MAIKNLLPKLSYLQFMIIILIILFIGYSLGLMIVNTINKKLKEISINVPKQDVIVNVKEQFVPKKVKKINSKIPEYNTLVDDEDIKYINAMDDIENICYKNHEHMKCNCGVMNYGDPLRMSQIDRNAFKYSFNCNKCTLQDYINWLYMYIKDPFNLPYSHRRNLKKLTTGNKVKRIPQLNLNLGAVDYFNRLFNKGSHDENLFKKNDKYEGGNYQNYSNNYRKINKLGSIGTD